MSNFPEFKSDNNNLLSLHGLDNFQVLWQLDIPWFEEPNHRRNGWSGVSRMELEDESGQKKGLFIKRQENHNHRSLLHPIQGIPTFRREFKNFQNLEKAQVPTLNPIFYSERKANSGFQAILVTEALDQHISAEDYFKLQHPQEEVHHVLESMATASRLLHNANFRHGCLYPKHFFINASKPELVDVRIIDLEKLRWLPIRSAVMFNDVDRLIRRRDSISPEFIDYFVQQYLTGPGKSLRNSSLDSKLQLSLKKMHG